MRVIDPSDFLSEEEVLKRWPMLTRAELRRARNGTPPKIEFYAFAKKTGGPCYTPEQVQAYIDATYLRTKSCVSTSHPTDKDLMGASRSEDTTSISSTPIEVATGTPPGMTPELARCAAEALAQQILSRRKSSSRRSSLSPRKPHKARPARTAF
jgi:hypothetical protein